ncbi:MAG: transposase [Candidatus Sumerlaeota bacterium]|nr:transposase [Candidatus Sumerlaeota bacterium]
MSQSLAQLYTHLIFSTKCRIPLIDASISPKLWAYIGGILRNLDSPSIEIGGFQDHIHILYSQSKNYALKTVLEEIKKSSSKWIKTQGASYKKFYWQGGYGAFSVSPSRLESVRRYIRNQEAHHKKMTFQDEYRQFMKEYNLAFDEQYGWD